MHPSYLFLCLVSVLNISSSSYCQTSASLSFLGQVQTVVFTGRPVSTVKLSGNAEWVAGSLRETGTAQLEAHSNGSGTLQLLLDTASQSETQTVTDAEKTCQRTNGLGASHTVIGANCNISIAWFAPILFAQPTAQLPTQLLITDDGLLTKDGVSLHQITYRLALQGRDTGTTTRLRNASAVRVLYDPRTFLPSRVEYAMFSNQNDLQSIPVEVVFDDYRPTDGIMLPFLIERYVQRTLQLAIKIDSASIN